MRQLGAILLLSYTLPAAGQTPAIKPAAEPAKPKSSAEAMLSAIEKQRASVRRQSPGSAATHSFFTVAWTSPGGSSMSASGGSVQADCEPLSGDTLSGLVKKNAEAEGVSAALIRAVVMRESGGKPCAVSSKGAQGMMQLMPATQADLGVKDPLDAAENISAGTRYLKQLLTRYSGNTSLALAAYNAGPNRVEPNGKIPDIPETQGYVTDVLSTLESLKAEETKQN